jgi:hypothetical protein
LSHVRAQSPFAIELDCSENTTWYKATALGSLNVTGRDAAGDLVVSGDLDVSVRVREDSPHSDRIAVQGTANKDGSSVRLDPTGTGTLPVLKLWITHGSYLSSSLVIEDSSASDGERHYSMDCNASRLRLPQIKDLAVAKWRSFAIVPPNSGAGYIDNVLFVTNVGSQTIPAGPIRVRVAGREIVTVIRSDASGGDGSIRPDFGGEIPLNFAPSGVLRRCQSYEVVLDLDHTVQSSPAPDPTGTFSPYGDDADTVASPCLTWTTPIDTYVLGAWWSRTFISGRTLQEVVDSEAVGRPDGKLCSECHFPTTDKRYKPPTGHVAPTREIVGRSWGQPGGWAQSFIAQDGRPGSTVDKPVDLRRAFQRWLDDGARYYPAATSP